MKKVFSILSYVLCLAVVLSTVFFPKEKESEVQPTIVRVWNVDTFEGGKGSRTAFLKKCAKIAQGKTSCRYLVTSYTKEGAIDAKQRGEIPDILSFGIGLDVFLENTLALNGTFIGGQIDGKTYAVPWCRGGYYLFSLADFEGEGECAISCGGDNLTEVSAAMSDITGKCLPSLTAYVQFLNGEFAYLLGTQRDICRFSARGVSVQSKELIAYNDLYQYCSVLTQDKWDECLLFLEVLFSDEVQNTLDSIGMKSVFQDGKNDATAYTTSVFLSDQARGELRSLASKNERDKMLANFIKKV